MEYIKQLERLAVSLSFTIRTLPDSDIPDAVIETILTPLALLILECKSLKHDSYENQIIVTSNKSDKQTSLETLELSGSHIDVPEISNPVSNVLKCNEPKIDVSTPKDVMEDILQDNQILTAISSNIKVTLSKSEEAEVAENCVENESTEIEQGEIRVDPANTMVEIKSENIKFKLAKTKSEPEYCKYYCLFCRKHFEAIEDYFSHDQRFHTFENKYKCPECDLVEDSKIEVIKHFSSNHKTQTNIIFCNECQQAFYEIRHLRKHLLVLHEKGIPMECCLMCGESFEHYRKAVHHMKVIHQNLKVRCSKNQCHKLFDNMEQLKLHLETHIIPDTQICPECGKEFKKCQNAELKRHVTLHSMTEEQFNCSLCDSKFFFENDLKNHVDKKHIKKYKCEQCDRKYGLKCFLKRHIEEFHVERKHMCTLCGKTFRVEKYLKDHTLLHSDVRNEKCDVCGKGFKVKKGLLKHRKIHLNEYEAQCQKCDKNFIQKSNWKLHMVKFHPECLVSA